MLRFFQTQDQFLPMSLNERTYMQPRAQTPRQPLTLCQILLGLNIAVFLLDRLFLDMRLEAFGEYSTQLVFVQHQLWRLITFQFLHASVGHIVANMMGLYFFGPYLERWWGRGKFLTFYLLCGASGALMFSLLSHIPALQAGANASLIGASAGIYGILVGAAILVPNLRGQLLIPPVELSIRTMVIGVLAFALFTIFFQFGSNVGGEIGHLGGAILGFFLVKFPQILGKSTSREISRPGPINRDQELDRILEKISHQGLQSLTPREREFLQDQSQNR